MDDFRIDKLLLGAPMSSMSSGMMSSPMISTNGFLQVPSLFELNEKAIHIAGNLESDSVGGEFNLIHYLRKGGD